MSAPDRCPRCGIDGMSSGATLRSHLLREDREHLADLALVRRVEQRDVHLGAALPLQVDRQQVGPGRQQHPDDAAAIPRVAHLRRDHAEHAARRSGVAVLLASAERDVGLIDDHDDRAHGAQHRQHAFEVALGLADVLRSEVLEHHARHANLAADALRKERLAGADRSADQIAHRHAVERAALEQRRILAQPLLRRLVADDRVERPLRLDELEQPVALALDQPLLQLAEDFRVEPAAALACRLHDDVEVGERDARGQRGQLRGVVVREGFERVSDRQWR